MQYRFYTLKYASCASLPSLGPQPHLLQCRQTTGKVFSPVTHSIPSATLWSHTFSDLLCSAHLPSSHGSRANFLAHSPCSSYRDPRVGAHVELLGHSHGHLPARLILWFLWVPNETVVSSLTSSLWPQSDLNHVSGIQLSLKGAFQFVPWRLDMAWGAFSV